MLKWLLLVTLLLNAVGSAQDKEPEPFQLERISSHLKWNPRKPTKIFTLVAKINSAKGKSVKGKMLAQAKLTEPENFSVETLDKMEVGCMVFVTTTLSIHGEGQQQGDKIVFDIGRSLRIGANVVGPDGRPIPEFHNHAEISMDIPMGTMKFDQLFKNFPKEESKLTTSNEKREVSLNLVEAENSIVSVFKRDLGKGPATRTQTVKFDKDRKQIESVSLDIKSPTPAKDFSYECKGPFFLVNED